MLLLRENLILFIMSPIILKIYPDTPPHATLSARHPQGRPHISLPSLPTPEQQERSRLLLVLWLPRLHPAPSSRPVHTLQDSHWRTCLLPVKLWLGRPTNAMGRQPVARTSEPMGTVPRTGGTVPRTGGTGMARSRTTSTARTTSSASPSSASTASSASPSSASSSSASPNSASTCTAGSSSASHGQAPNSPCWFQPRPVRCGWLLPNPL